MNQIKNLTAFLLIFTCSIFFGQSENVGINIDNPQQKLHVSGASTVLNSNIGTTGIKLISPTIRVDGLNITNNSSIFTAAETTNPLYVNNLGRSGVVNGSQLITNTTIGSDAIPTAVQLNYPSTTGAYQLTTALLTVSFTLPQRSVVYITSSLSAEITDTSTSNAILNDPNNKSVIAQVSFTSAPASTGLTSNFTLTDNAIYANNTTSSINTFKLSPSGELVLPAGDYTVILRGGTIGVAGRPAYRVFFGGGTGDKLNVFTKPL